MKILISGLFCLCFALIPETIMYFIYNLVSPETVFQKILIFGVFGAFGLGFCCLFAWLALMMFCVMIEKL